MRLAALALLAGLVLAGPGLAHDYAAGALRIDHPWTRPAAAGFNGAGYMAIRNTGKTPDTLLGAETAGARSISLHQSVMAGDMASMKALPKGVAIAPGQTLKLEPGGYHFMILGLKAAQNPGGRLPVTLVFAKAGRVKVELSVDTAPPPTKGADMGHMH